MAKKIKFPLEMADGVQVRTIEELREKFNLEKILEYFIDGRLLTWLNDRYYEIEAAQIIQLSKEDAEIDRKLCDIFDVDYQEDNQLDIEEIHQRNQKLDKLKQFTDDEKILANVNSVAFTQEELAELLDDEKDIIYLCKGEFTIPVSQENIKYIGVGNPIVHIKSSIKIDLIEKQIILENITLDDKSKSMVITEDDNVFLHSKTNANVVVYRPYKDGSVIANVLEEEKYLYSYDDKKIFIKKYKIYIEDQETKEMQLIAALGLYNMQKLIFCGEYLFFIYMVGNNRGNHLCRYSFKDDYVIEIDTYVYEATISDERLFYVKSDSCYALSRRSIIQTNVEATEKEILIDFGETSSGVYDLKCVGDTLYYSRKTADIMGFGEIPRGYQFKLKK